MTFLDCACVIHGNAYDFAYVDKLYSMLTRNLTRPVRLHVYTESERSVPEPYIKHALIDWGIGGPKQAWWYKLQMFNSDHHRGSLLYFDLDTVIVDNIDWIWQLPQTHFWAIRDFKYLWKPTFTGINSSVMWWNTAQFEHVWQHVKNQDLMEFFRKFRGDQDFISNFIPLNQRHFFDLSRVKSWRWQCLDGGFNFSSRIYSAPGTGTLIAYPTSLLIFHGNPKPSETPDPLIKHYWQ